MSKSSLGNFSLNKQSQLAGYLDNKTGFVNTINSFITVEPLPQIQKVAAAKQHFSNELQLVMFFLVIGNSHFFIYS
jgi:hypothetical protein